MLSLSLFGGLLEQLVSRLKKKKKKPFCITEVFPKHVLGQYKLLSAATGPACSHHGDTRAVGPAPAPTATLRCWWRLEHLQKCDSCREEEREETGRVPSGEVS